MKQSLTVGFFLFCFCFLFDSNKNVQSFELNHKLDDWLKLFKDTDMFVNKDEAKKVDFLKPIFPSMELKLKTKIGQIGGIDTDVNGDLLLFHRGSRQWDYDSFIGNKFNRLKYGPIKENTLTLINTKNLVEIDSWGANTFYMPHGATIDFENNIWITDVGLHQVFKYSPSNLEKPLLVLGVKFENGNDEKRFCKPTDVSVSESTGDIFVSDGYCNKRIAQFDKNGNFKKQFEDKQNALRIAHSITLIEKLNLVCTVSRQDGRIVCFDIETGDKKHEITDDQMLTCYAIEYDPNNELLHAATGDNREFESIGLTFFASKDNFGKLKQKWSSNERDLKRVHDIALSPDGSSLYLGQLNGEIEQFTYE